MRNQRGYQIRTHGRLLRVNVLHSEAAVGTQILITQGSDSILVDAGDGTLRDLVERRFKFETLRAVLVTHEHFDHICGLYPLVNFLKLLGRKEPLLIATPSSPVRVNALLRPPIMYYSPELSISFLDMSTEDELCVGSLRIRAFAVSHAGISAVGYSITDDDHRIVISGDTRPCPNLEREVKGADIALLECTYDDEDRRIAHEYGHMTKNDAKTVARGAKRSILIHNPPKGYFRGINRECQSK